MENLTKNSIKTLKKSKRFGLFVTFGRFLWSFSIEKLRIFPQKCLQKVQKSLQIHIA